MFALPSMKKCIFAFFASVFLFHILFVDDSSVSGPEENCDSSDLDTDVYAVSLLQEGVQIVASRSVKDRGNGEKLVAASKAYSTCHNGKVELGSEADGEETDLDAKAFRFAKPYRLRTVGIAVLGFALLSLDSSAAVLLAF
mmetsp:Transcript_88740/g.235693  ORF Transcript_88740/g.235693 Transcript_88740/m.235693 type:complete len:141 (-) Transcript_88740:85-507(-)